MEIILINTGSTGLDGMRRTDLIKEETIKNEYGNYRFRMEIPTFNGYMWIEEVLDWLTDVERFFEVMEISEKQMVKIVSVRLKFGTSVWWKLTQFFRARQQLIRKRFLPKDYQSPIPAISKLQAGHKDCGRVYNRISSPSI